MSSKFNQILILALVLLGGCRQPALLPIKYVEWLNDPDNGAHVNKQIGKYDFDLQYKTPEYMVLMSERKSSITVAQMSTQKKAYEDLEQYTFKIRSASNEDLLQDGNGDDYNRRLEYFISYIQEDLFLENGNDTVFASLCNYERTYGLSPEATITIGFDTKNIAKHSDRTFIFDDHILGVGPVRLTITKESLSHLPVLTYEN